MAKKTDSASPLPYRPPSLSQFQQRAYDQITMTDKNVILVGPSGSGKTTMLSMISEQEAAKGKKVLRCAPTGITANALGKGGMTFNHALGLPLDLIQEGKLISIEPQKYRGLDTLIIDCISRCKPHILDAIWNAYETAAQEGHPFRIIAAGDFFQIGPSIPSKEKRDLKLLPDYEGKDALFPFQASHWNDFSFENVFLPEPYDSPVPDFSKALCHLRIGDKSAIPIIQRMTAQNPIKDALWVYTKKDECARKNAECISELNEQITEVHCIVKGCFPAEDLPAPKTLEICNRMRILFTVNDPKNRFRNGSQGYIQSISQDPKTGEYIIYAAVDGRKGRIRLEPYTWDNKNPDGTMAGTFTQFPILPGYAVTLHRISGARLEAVNISPSCWGHGQLYSLLILVSDPNRIYIDGQISSCNLIIRPEVTEWEDFEFYQCLDFDEMVKELKTQMSIIKVAYIPTDSRRNGLRFGAQTYSTVLGNQRIERTFIVLYNEQHRPVCVTNFSNYLKPVKAVSAANNIGHKIYFIVQFLNFCFIDVGDVNRLEEITIEHVRDFVHAYGYKAYGGRAHTTGTFHECVAILLRFLTALINDKDLDMTLTEDDLFVRDVSITKHGAKLIMKLHPSFTLTFDPENHHLLREMPEAAFRHLISLAVRDYPDLLMNIALGFCAGLRPSETCCLSRSDMKIYYTRAGTLAGVRINLNEEKPLRDDGKILGRIKKERNVEIHESFLPLFQAFLEHYMPWWEAHCKDAAHQPLCLDGSGQAMSYQDYYRRFKKLVQDLIPICQNDPDDRIRYYGQILKEEGIAPHIFRHLFSQTLVLMGFNAFQIMEMRGDTSPESANVYLARKSDLLNIFDRLVNEMVVALKAENSPDGGKGSKEKKKKKQAAL